MQKGEASGLTPYSLSPGAGFWIHILDSKIGGSTTLQTASDTSWMRKDGGVRGVVATWNQEGTWEGHVQEGLVNM